MEYAGEAMRDASTAIELDPTYSKGQVTLFSFLVDRYYRLASAHYYTGDFEAALKDFKKCLQLNPSSKLIWRSVFILGEFAEKWKRLRSW